MSVAYDIMPQPDWAATTTIAIPDGAVYDADGWARAVFDVTRLSPWVKGPVRAA